MNFHSGIMTDFSIGQSLLTVEKLIASAKELGIEKLIVADDMTISSLISLQTKAKAEGIQAMVGVKFRCYQNPTYRKVAGQPMQDNPYVSVKIYPRDETALQSIFRVLTKANSTERFYYNARGSFEDLKELENCVVTTGDIFGIHSSEHFEKLCENLSASCGFYIELIPISTPYWLQINKSRLEHLHDERVKGLIATLPAMAKDEEETETLPVLKAVCTNTKINEEDLSVNANTHYSLDKAADISNMLLEFGCKLAKITGKDERVVADIISKAYTAPEFNAEPFYVFEKHAPCLPKMAEDEFTTLVKLCQEGFKTRLFEDHLGYKPDASMIDTYKKRLVYELSVLKKLGFAGYFLVVRDLVMWSKQNGVGVGPGRGSGGGSLVAYLTGITEVDPIRFNLIFERFINPERIDLPDIDLDYQSSKRGKVIEYLNGRYGEDRVAGISNYGTLASASAFRDAGRVFGLTPQDMEATKLVPKDAGVSFSLTEAADAVPEIDKLKDDYPVIWKHALKLEGVMRSLGQHAAGTVVAGEPLVNRAVVEHRSEGNVVNWDKRVVEDYGLIKMDILGLSTLDVLDIAKGFIKERHEIDVDYLKLPLNDTKVLDAFGRGETTAVFQFDSQGMQTLLKRLAKNERLTFDDISAATALYRPGPLDSGLTDDYVAIKQGIKEPYYDHPNMKAALESTYGVMVYQEQIMQVCRDLAGFTMAESDAVRKAIGKKDHEKMAKMADKFIQGCMSVSGMTESKARLLWTKIEKFASYSFNKSHSVAYSILSYWTCWVKTYYPAEYFAAQLSIVHEDKYPALIRDANSCGIAVLPPDVNFSSERYGIKDDKTIVMPFSAIKGCSERISTKIVEARNNNGGRFSSMDEFVKIAGTKGSGINKRVVENLNKVGAFADIEPTQPKANDDSRKTDQIELMPGLIVDTVVSTSTTHMDEKKKLEVLSIYAETTDCKNCNLCGKVHPTPVVGGAKCRFMMVFDCPNGDEEKNGKMFTGTGSIYVKKSLKDAGVSAAQGYYTALVKSKKTDKFLTNAQINGCSGYLDREVELLKPGVIVCMGSASAKHFLPDLKSPSLEVGNAFYNPKLKASIIVGLNPLQLIFAPEKIKTLDKVSATLARTLGLS